MELKEAIKKCFKPDVYEAMKSHLSPPEMLNAAALECFLHYQPEEVESTIKAALIFLRQIGTMPETI